MYGAGSLGVTGTGAGGGGSRSGAGDFGKLGRGHSIALSVGDGAGRGTGETSVRSGKVIYKGGLDKEVIRRVVIAHLPQVKYCYERRLVVNPALKGKLIVRFTIAADGRVVSATASDDTIGDAEVTACVLTRATTWRFPAPAGGGIVDVIWPFLFASSP